MKRDSTKQQQGFVLVAVALTLIILIGFVALGVDTGVLYGAKTSAQGVADAAAMAGAFTFTNSPTAPQPETASNYALQVALSNSVMGRAIAAEDVTVTPDVANRKVTVTIKTTQNTYFARVLWSKSIDIRATATAEAAVYCTGSACVKPWFLPNTLLSTGVPCDNECDPSKVMIHPITKEVTSFALSKLGTQITIKPQDPAGALGNGSFYAIEFPGSNGASGYRDAIVSCKSPYLHCGDKLSIQTGNMDGPTAQGVDILIGNPPRFTWVASGQYKRVADGKMFDMTENVILTPIWSSCGTGFCPGGAKVKGELEIVGYAAVFVEGQTKDEVFGRLINVSSCGPVIGPPSGGTNLSLPLRLVR